MSFDTIRDQQMAIRLLRNVLTRDRIPNGMLFAGPDGVGKRLTAIQFAKAIFCGAQAADACNACLTCRKVSSGNYPDIKEVAPTAKSREIKKKDVDEINELAALRPFEAARRIFVIHDADRMNPTAQNHFLKTLEEPPGASLFVLLSSYPGMLLPTIRSRCQLVRFRTLRTETVTDLLMAERDLPRDLAESIAGIADGQMSRALDLVDSEKRDIVLSITDRLADGESPVRLAEEFAKHLNEQRKQIELRVDEELGIDRADEVGREDLERMKEEQLAHMQALVRRTISEYLYLLATWYRDEMVYAACADDTRIWNRDRLSRLHERQSTDPAAKVQAIERARVYLDRHINEERVFRDLFLTLAAP